MGTSAARPGLAEEGKRVGGERKEAVVQGGQKEVAAGEQTEAVVEGESEGGGEQREVVVEHEQRAVVVVEHEHGRREAAVAFWWSTCLARLEQGVAEARACGCFPDW